MHQHRTDALAPLDRSSLTWPVGPRTTTLLAATVGACVGLSVGMDWLAEPVLGVPASLWLIGSLTYLAHVRSRRLSNVADTGQDANEPALPLPIRAAVQHTSEALAAIAGWASQTLHSSTRWRGLERALNRRFQFPALDVQLPDVSDLPRFSNLSRSQDLRHALSTPAHAVAGAISGAAHTAAGALGEAVNGVATSTANSVLNPERLGRGVQRLMRSRSSGVDRPIRIGLDLREAEHVAISLACSRMHMDSHAFNLVRHAPGAFVDSAREIDHADVLVRRSPDKDQGLFAFLPEHATAPAAWYDWSIQPPLCFASVFPARLDCARLSLGACDLSRPAQAELVSAMITAAASYVRHPARHTAPSWKLQSAPTQSESQTVRTRQLQAMTALAEAFDRLMSDPIERSSAPAELLASASNILSAWCATQDHHSASPVHAHAGHHTPICAERRMNLASLACEGFEKHAPQVLRLAAAQFAAGHDDDALRSLQWGVRVLRSANAECTVDPLAFVQSEIELGQPGGLSTGRIAAGLALLWATTDTSRHPFLRDDLTDDLRHAGWLMGRDHDRAVLERVMLTLEAMDEALDAEPSHSHLTPGYASSRAAA